MRLAHRKFLTSGAAEILIVYQKEPHAGQMAFADIAQPESLEERYALARRMKVEYELPMTVLVDTMKDESRALFSDLPSPAFVIDKEGIVRAKFPWAEGEQIMAAVAAMTGEPVEGTEAATPEPDEESTMTAEARQADRPWPRWAPLMPLVFVALLALRAIVVKSRMSASAEASS